jgi:hypothetical protein
MKNLTIWKSLSQIREDYIEEAAPDKAAVSTRSPKSVQRRIIEWGALAACFALVAGFAITGIGSLLGNPIATDEFDRYETRPAQNYVVTQEASWREWGFPCTIDGQQLVWKFPIIEWEGETYGLAQDHKSFIQVQPDQIGEILEEIQLNVRELSDQQISATVNATISAYKGIDPAYGVVLTIEGVEAPVLYRSGKYADSFEELMKKTNLQEYLTSYDYIIHTTQNKQGEDVKIAFEEMTAEILWEQLLAYGKTVDYTGEDSDFLRIGVGHELLRPNSFVLCISEDGYITLAMLKAGKAIYVGADRVQAFMDYLDANHPGYRLVEKDYSVPEGEMNTVTVTSKAHLN